MGKPAVRLKDIADKTGFSTNTVSLALRESPRIPPQTGELNYPVIFDAVDAMGWNGWVGAEYGPGGPTVDSLSWGRPYGIGV